MTAHPLLTKVLADAITSTYTQSSPVDGLLVSTHIPSDIADWLEASLAVCARCHSPERWVAHPALPYNTDTHDYVPLVTP